MKLLGVLQWMLLVALKYSEETCTKDIELNWYYIYNTTVEIDVYYCTYSHVDHAQCKDSDSVQIQTDYASFLDRCRRNFFVQLSRLHQRKEGSAKVCRISAHVNLQEDLIVFPDTKSCRYSHMMCHNDNIMEHVFWDEVNFCRKIPEIYKNLFTSWKNQINQTFISVTNMSLELREKIDLCGTEMWRTNLEEVIVSAKAVIRTPNASLAPPNLQTSFEEFCQREPKPYQNTPTWHVYNFSTSVPAYTCHKNLQTSCSLNLHLNSSQTVPADQDLLNQCKKNFFNVPAHNTRSNITICSHTLEVDLDTDSVRQLPSECKYSDGICTSMRMFWNHPERCGAIGKAYEAEEGKCGYGKCLTGNIELKLLRKGKLCGETVWFTDQNGLVASKEELEFMPSKISLPLHQDNEMPADEDDTTSEEIEDLESSLWYLLYILVACTLWYAFNVMVNFSSLRKLNRRKPPKERVSLLNCLSDGLTLYHLSLNGGESKPKEVTPKVEAPQLYESVENELYNKSTKLDLKG